MQKLPEIPRSARRADRTVTGQAGQVRGALATLCVVATAQTCTHYDLSSAEMPISRYRWGFGLLSSIRFRTVWDSGITALQQTNAIAEPQLLLSPDGVYFLAWKSL